MGEQNPFRQANTVQGSRITRLYNWQTTELICCNSFVFFKYLFLREGFLASGGKSMPPANTPGPFTRRLWQRRIGVMREHTSPVYHQTLALWTPSKNRPANAVSGKVFLSGRQAQSLQRLKLKQLLWVSRSLDTNTGACFDFHIRKMLYLPCSARHGEANSNRLFCT